MGKEASKRQRQVSELIRRNMGMVLQEEGSYIYENALVTVTNVVMSPDLSLAKVYLSVYNTENKQAVLLMIEDQQSRLQSSLGRKIRKHVRRIPEVNFYIDETLDEMYRVNHLFDKLEKENQMGKDREEDIEE